MDRILDQLRLRFPELNFVTGTTFCWIPERQEIVLGPEHSSDSAGWSLLHETSHALLGHRTYQSDFELLSLETAAWEKAKELAQSLDTLIDEDHIQDCLDSYRDWIYARSICPQCNNKGLQQADLRQYRCFNCRTSWRVTPSRFCRAYRSTQPRQSGVQSFDALSTLRP